MIHYITAAVYENYKNLLQMFQQYTKIRMIARNGCIVTSTFLESKKKMSFTLLILASLSQ